MQTVDIKKLKRIYWLCDAVTDRHRELALRLTRVGYGVQFFGTLESMLSDLSRQRAPIIVLGDEASPQNVERAISQIASTPEAQGVRLILSVSKPNSRLSFVAACSNFRDLIPLDLPEQQWLERFIFATARSPVSLPELMPQLALNQLAALTVPARLVWISDRRLLFEAKIRPPIGANLVLSGKFAESLGLKRISLSVEECRRTDLIYRFSDAVIARWNVPEAARESSRSLLARMRQTDFGPRVKVFLGIQDAELRNHMVKELDPLRFEVNVALQKQSLVDEPRYFCPQIVFLEDKLCIGPDLDRIRQMFEVLAPDVPVYVVGNRVQIRNVQNLDPLRKVIMLQRIPPKLTEAVFTKFLPANSRKNVHADEGAVHITPDHPFSMVELHISSRLTRLHPTSVQLALPFSMGVYGLVRVDSPDIKKALGYAPFAKVTLSYENYRLNAGSFPYVAEGYICDANLAGQRKLAQGLNQQLAQSFGVAEKVTAQHGSAHHLPRAVGSDLSMPHVSVPPPPPTRAQINMPEMPSFAEFSKFEDDDENAKGAPIQLEMDQVVSKIGEVINDSGKATLRILKSKDVRNLAIFVCVTAGLFYLLYFFISYVAPHYEKSGGVYTDSLKKFAPRKFEHPTENTDQGDAFP